MNNRIFVGDLLPVGIPLRIAAFGNGHLNICRLRPVDFGIRGSIWLSSTLKVVYRIVFSSGEIEYPEIPGRPLLQSFWRSFRSMAARIIGLRLAFGYPVPGRSALRSGYRKQLWALNY